VALEKPNPLIKVRLSQVAGGSHGYRTISTGREGNVCHIDHIVELSVNTCPINILAYVTGKSWKIISTVTKSNRKRLTEPIQHAFSVDVAIVMDIATHLEPLPDTNTLLDFLHRRKKLVVARVVFNFAVVIAVVVFWLIPFLFHTWSRILALYVC
jgi:hypothetical protein